MPKKNNPAVAAAINKARDYLEKDKDIPVACRVMMELLISVIEMLTLDQKANSKNSSLPPSKDPNRIKKSKNNSTGKKAGGQKGSAGTTLSPVSNPDEIKVINMDKKKYPKSKYTHVGYEKRQVINIEIKRIVTEYQAEIVQDNKGNRHVADFPEEAKSSICYGNNVKAKAVYMNQHQMIPYQRIQEYFNDQMNTPMSVGSIFTFNKEAYKRLEEFESIVKDNLIGSEIIHADETSINVGGKRIWLHVASNSQWVHCSSHNKRGVEAMNDVGILPEFTGVLCHDHWKPYYTYTSCLHSLCNAHHLRELEAQIETGNQPWAKQMQDLLLQINNQVTKSDGVLAKKDIDIYTDKYRKILQDAVIDNPAPQRKKGQKGRLKKSKALNLIDRLIKHEDDVLRFMKTQYVPFTNNQGENDIRMAKVKEKISGCFRSDEGAKIFCRMRSYILTCQRHGIKPTKAIKMIFDGTLPDFVNST